MAAFNKFQTFVTDLSSGVHNLGTDTLKIYLSNDAPDAATDKVKADLAEIAGGNGYVSGGAEIQNVGNSVNGTFTLTGTDVTWIAAGGAVGPFRYVVLYNDTPTSPNDPLIGWWDYGSSITLQDTESFTVDFGASIFTIV